MDINLKYIYLFLRNNIGISFSLNISIIKTTETQMFIMFLNEVNKREIWELIYIYAVGMVINSSFSSKVHEKRRWNQIKYKIGNDGMNHK